MAKITAVEYYLPEGILTNEMLEIQFPDFRASKIEKKLGIYSRHIAAAEETALDLGQKAAELAFRNFDRERIDFLLFCTQSPDYFLPTSACILQESLGLRKDIGALDYNLGCSGFIYGLGVAKGLIAAGLSKCVLLVTSETYSKYLARDDKGNRSIFGDGAAATIIEQSKMSQIMDFVFGTDGRGKDNLIVRNGAARYSQTDDSSGDYLQMNGPEIFNFTIDVLPDLVTRVLQKNSFTMAQIDYVIFHQANQYILLFLAEKIGIPLEKFYINIQETGNTVCASIPIAIKQAKTQKLIKEGDRILLAGFGVGYSYGATIITI